MLLDVNRIIEKFTIYFSFDDIHELKSNIIIFYHYKILCFLLTAYVSCGTVLTLSGAASVHIGLFCLARETSLERSVRRMPKTTCIRVNSTARRSGKNIVVKTTASVNGRSRTKTTTIRPK